MSPFPVAAGAGVSADADVGLFCVSMDAAVLGVRR